MPETKDKRRDGFAREMAALQEKTELQIVDICSKYELDPLQAIHFFGLQILNAAAELKIRLAKKYNKERDNE